MYEIYLERQAERDLRRLPKEIARRLIQEILKLQDNPRPPQARKLSRAGQDWRLRVSTYRIIFEIDDKAKIVRIMRVRHRREAYE